MTITLPALPNIRWLFFCALLLSPSMLLAQDLVLSGIGVYNEFNKPNMVVKIESAEANTDLDSADQRSVTNRLSLRIIEPKTERRWSHFWSQSLSFNNSPDSLTNNIDDLLTMNSILRGPLEPGDLIQLERRADSSVVFRVNTVELTDFENPFFYEFVITAFTGRVPPSSSLKQQLLGNNDSVNETTTLFDMLDYASVREDIIWGWVDAMEAEGGVASEEESAPEQEEETLASADESVSSDDEENLEAVIEEVSPDIAETEDETLLEVATLESALDSPDSDILADSSEAEVSEEPSREDREALREAARTAALESLIAQQGYLILVRNKVNSNMEYPRSAVRRSREGTVRVSVTINRDGSINSTELVEATPYDSLNEAALDGIAKAAPFEPIPESVMGEDATAEFPISFYLN